MVNLTVPVIYVKQASFSVKSSLKFTVALHSHIHTVSGVALNRCTKIIVLFPSSPLFWKRVSRSAKFFLLTSTFISLDFYGSVSIKLFFFYTV